MEDKADRTESNTLLPSQTDLEAMTDAELESLAKRLEAEMAARNFHPNQKKK